MPEIKALKPFQYRAIESAVALFDANRERLDAAGVDAESRRNAIGYHGYLLLEAPTGAGKTLMAGSILEQFSAREQVAWFWFAPFKGVTGQTEDFLRDQFKGLRLRDLSDDRMEPGARAGDVFVTTWASVATKNKEGRKARTDGELNPSVDSLVEALRAAGFRIGVVVDEAHHGFHGKTQAASFYHEVLDPDYTILVTATPDDKEIKDFEKARSVDQLNRITISREDVVNAGLIKEGVKCVAYFTEESKKPLVDFEETAIRDGSELHQKLKAELTKLGIALTPLMLVQVDSTKGSIERAKEKLLRQNFKEEQIAIHTANEPDADILALANDEQREVLIFKMSVALGFDAPRAFTLVSMRAAKDADFGVQLVGRILRVHRRLQGRTMPPALNYGTVFLADSEVQTGIQSAGERINALKTAYAEVTNNTAVVRLGESNTVQVLGPSGQTQLLTFPRPLVSVTCEGSGQTDEDSQSSGDDTERRGLLDGFFQLDGGEAREYRPEYKEAIAAANAQGSKTHSYPIRKDVPKLFKTEALPEDFEDIENECASHFVLESEQLVAALRAQQKVQMRTLDVFTGQLELGLAKAQLSREEIALRASRILQRNDMFDPRCLQDLLLVELKAAFDRHDLSRLVEKEEDLMHALDVLLVSRPELLAQAQRRAFAAHTIIEQAAPLPQTLESPFELPSSQFNIYQRFPHDLNSWEREFAQMLDNDMGQNVKWWHRNDPRKAWSICAIMSNGRRFFPDFIVGVQDRKKEDNALLVDPKFDVFDEKNLPKIDAEHQVYGKIMILRKFGEGNAQEFYTVRYDESRRAATKDRSFHLGLMQAY